MPCENILEELDKVLEIGEEKKAKRARKTKTKEATKKSKPKKLTKKEQQIIELANNTVLPDHYETIWTRKQLLELGDWIAEQEYLAIDTETMGTNPFMDEIVGISFYAPHKGFYIPIKHMNDINVNEALRAEKEAKEAYQIVGVDYVQCIPKQEITKILKPLLENPNIKLLLHNSTFDAHVMHNWMGIDIMSQVYYDTLVGAKLLDENVSAALKDLATRYLKIPSDRFGKIFGKTTFDKAPILINPNTKTGNIATFYATKDTELTYKLWLFQKAFIEKPTLKDIRDLMFNIELPFLGILYKAEQKGIPFDTDYIMNTVKPALETEVEELRQKIWAYTGEINLKAPAQVAEALYVRMGLPSVNKDKPKCTDKKTLNKLTKIHEVAKYLLEFRAKSKLYDAFVSKLPLRVIDGKIHPSFGSLTAKTGRPSCKNPNLLQIPQGGLIRNAFHAEEGRLLSSHDYGAQELRILAHISKDPILLDVYRNGKDVHAMTGAMIYNLTHPDDIVDYDTFQYCREVKDLLCDKEGNPDEEKLSDNNVNQLYSEGLLKTTDRETLLLDITRGKLMEKCRKKAKSVNFGIVYGISSKGLSDQLGVTEDEAQQYIDGFFVTYPGVAKWMKDTHNEIYKKKYVTTLLGRKRRLYPEMDSGVRWKIGSAMRMGCNAMIQGSMQGSLV